MLRGVAAIGVVVEEGELLEEPRHSLHVIFLVQRAVSLPLGTSIGRAPADAAAEPRLNASASGAVKHHPTYGYCSYRYLAVNCLAGETTFVAAQTARISAVFLSL